MGLLTKKSEEEKAAERTAKAEARRAEAEANEKARTEKQAADAAAAEKLQAHVASIPKWEYQVKRVGEDKQKGLLGSQRMETIFNVEGKAGWELVAIHEERATFKRRLPE
jgi:hypothetical protein